MKLVTVMNINGESITAARIYQTFIINKIYEKPDLKIRSKVDPKLKDKRYVYCQPKGIQTFQL